MRFTTAVLVTWCAGLLCSCQQRADSLSAADTQAINAGSDRFVKHLLAGNADSLSQLYASDAIVMAANMPEIRGRDAIRAFFAAFPPVAEAALMNDTIVGFGNLAYVRGRYRSRFAEDGAPLDSGKFVEIRQRQADGTWLFVLESFSTSVALPTPGK